MKNSFNETLISKVINNEETCRSPSPMEQSLMTTDQKQERDSKIKNVEFSGQETRVHTEVQDSLETATKKLETLFSYLDVELLLPSHEIFSFDSSEEPKWKTNLGEEESNPKRRRRSQAFHQSRDTESFLDHFKEALRKCFDGKLFAQNDEEVGFICPECGLDTQSRQQLDAHLLLHIDLSKQGGFDDDDDEFSLDDDNKSSSSSSTPGSDREPHKLFRCSVCSFETNHKCALISHTLCHKTEKKSIIKCPECDYETSRKNYMKVHIAKHGAAKRYKCDRCDFETGHKAALNRHAVIHGERKTFKCGQCDYVSTNRSTYRNHALKHYETKRFVCNCCHYKTNRKSHLKRHFLIHTDEILFRCSLCNYGTKHKSNLKRHVVKCH